MSEALRIINDHQNKGYMVSFERKRDGFLDSHVFPEKLAGEELIKTEEEAWDLARQFADATKGRCVNIYVVDNNFSPVAGYENKKIINR